MFRQLLHCSRRVVRLAPLLGPIRPSQCLLQNTSKHLSIFNIHRSPHSLSSSHEYAHNEESRTRSYFGSFASLTLLFALCNLINHNKKKYLLYAKENQDDTATEIVPGLEIAGLPVYSMEQVSKHNDANDPNVGVWIAYKAGVYDVSDFVKVHPGGDNIMLGAGNSVEPFWEVYGQHKTQQVYELLESFRIGNLRQEDRLKPSETSSDVPEYTPDRNPGLIVHHKKPFNAEAPTAFLQRFFTLNEEFFIRHHLSVPEVDPADYELEVEGLTVPETRTFTLEQLKSLFPKHTVASVIQCAGNRRDAFNELKGHPEVKGIPWGVGAIGNAQWSGAKLCDVLQYCGADVKDPRIEHVQFEGLDLDATSTPYGASVPADKALNPMNEFIIAYEMNGEPIPADHGFPVRLIAPGIAGARNVKWLGKIILSAEESHSHWQRNDYKSFPSSQNSATPEEFATALAIQEMPIQSAICTPAPDQSVSVQWKQVDGHTAPVIEAAGYAWSGGGRAIIRVDLSIDGGNTWHVAQLEGEVPKKPPHHTYSWTLWKVNLPLEATQLYQGNKIEIMCRAFDSSYNVQPKEANEVWNFRGLLNNSWHRVNVKVA